MPDTTIIERIANHIELNEGDDVDYPYLDVKGKVTAGPGFLVDDEASFIALPFRIGGRDATDAEKRAAFQALEAGKPEQQAGANRSSSSYKDMTELRLDPAFIQGNLNHEVADRIAKIKDDLDEGAWDRLTDGQKSMLVDIHYANGSLDKFPNLKKAANAGKADDMAEESLFFADSGRGLRDNERLYRNYVAALGKDADDPQARAAFDARLNEANRAWHERAKQEAGEIKDPAARKKRLEFLRNHPFANLKTSDTEPARSEGNDNSAEADDRDDRVAEKTASEPDGDDDFASVKSFLQSPGDDEDEALLKDDLTEDEVKRVMLSNAYNDNRDPRFKALNHRIAWWFEDRWGDGDARVDATGRMIQAEQPETPAPAHPLAASVAETGADLGREIGRVVDAVFGKAKRRSAPHPEPDEGRGGLLFRQAQHEGKGLDSRLRGHDDLGGTSPILSLQNVLNRDEVRHGVAVLDDLLKLDGIAGPKTRRMLRRAVAGFGADGITARL